MFKKLTTYGQAVFYLMLLSQCTEDGVPPEDGINGFNALVNVDSEPAGDNCSSGGIKISVGQDDNTNGTLDEAEIESISFICNGNNGASSAAPLLATSTVESAGANCEFGGILIEVGADVNLNSQLDADEVQTSFFICNGSGGSNGADGNDGTNGTDGSNGSNGLSSLTRVTTEVAGPNCTNGGLKIEIGLDTNENESLENEEIEYTYYVCNGQDGNDGTNGSNGTDGFNTIISTSTDTGGNCPDGGLAITMGLDSNRNGSIDTGEEIGTYYVCNGTNGNDGSNGSDGKNSLINISSFSGAQGGCSDGGLIVQSGIDDNENGMLDTPSEVDATSYICNGSDGTNGNSDSVFEFYYSEGLDGYKGVRDVGIVDKNPTQRADIFSVNEGGPTDYHGLLYFPELERMKETIGTDQFEIVEAVLYLRGVSVLVDAGTQENWIGVKNLTSQAPLFEEDQVNWQNANGQDVWSTAGASTTEDGGAHDYSDMFRLPPSQSFLFNGHIPLLLNRSEVALWTLDPSNNKGMVLLLADNSVTYELDIYSSNYVADNSFRPTLYIKARVNTNGRTEHVSDKTYKEAWDEKSYEEKLAPLIKRKQ